MQNNKRTRAQLLPDRRSCLQSNRKAQNDERAARYCPTV